MIMFNGDINLTQIHHLLDQRAEHSGQRSAWQVVSIFHLITVVRIRVRPISIIYTNINFILQSSLIRILCLLQFSL